MGNRRLGVHASGWGGGTCVWAAYGQAGARGDEWKSPREIVRGRRFERSTASGGRADGEFIPIKSDIRTSFTTWCDNEVCLSDPLVSAVLQRVSDVAQARLPPPPLASDLREAGVCVKGRHRRVPNVCCVRLIAGARQQLRVYPAASVRLHQSHTAYASAAASGDPSARRYKECPHAGHADCQFYRRHHDTIPELATMQPGPRVYTFFMYLSDVEEVTAT